MKKWALYKDGKWLRDCHAVSLTAALSANPDADTAELVSEVDQMQRAVALFKDHPELQELCKFATAQAQAFSEEEEFLNRQRAHFKKKIQDARKDMRQKLFDFAGAHGLHPPDVQLAKLHYHMDNESLTACDEHRDDEATLAALLARLFGD